jgi:hypothetical protein
MANSDKTFALNDEEITQAESLLARLEPGFLPFPLFLQIYRLTPAPTMDTIPLRRNSNGDIEVLLLRRPPDDPIWPNLWHNPGTVLRASDTYESALDRLLNDELQGARIVKDPVFVANIFNQSKRGTEVILIYRIEIKGPTPVGTFWPIDKLPKDIIDSEIAVIKTASQHYELSSR